MPSRFVRRTLCVVAVVLVTAVVPGAGVQAAATCSDVIVVGAAGSGELGAVDRSQPQDLLGATLREYVRVLRQQVPEGTDISERGVNYPASPLELLTYDPAGYLDSVRKGASALVKDIRTAAKECGGLPHLIVAGYSQGAWALHGALEQLDARTRLEIDTVVFVGDPLQLPRDAYVDTTGAVRLLAGPAGEPLVRHLSTVLGTRLREVITSMRTTDALYPKPSYVPVGLSARLAVACNISDIMCSPREVAEAYARQWVLGGQAQSQVWADLVHGHTSYAIEDAQAHATFRGLAVPATVRDVYFTQPPRLRTVVNAYPGDLEQGVRMSVLAEDVNVARPGTIQARPERGWPAALRLTNNARDLTVTVTGAVPPGEYRMSVTVKDALRRRVDGTITLRVHEPPSSPPTEESGSVRLSVTADGQPSSIPSYAAATSDDGRVAVHLSSDPSFGGSGLVGVLTDPLTGTRTALPSPVITQIPTGVAVSGDGTTVALVGDDGTQLVDTRTLAPSWLDVGAGSAFAELSADGGLLAVQSWPGVAVYDRDTGQVVATASPPAGQGVYYLIPMGFSADGRWLHVVDPDWRRAWRFDTVSGELTETAPVLADTRSIRYSDDGRLAVGVDDDGTVLVQDIATGSVERSAVPGITRAPASVWVSDDGQRFLYLAPRGETSTDPNHSALYLFDRATGQQTFVETADPQVAPSPAGDLAFTTFGRGVLDGGYSTLNMYWAPLD